VKSLDISQTDEPAGASASGYALVYSGNHKITLAFGG
jgi:hypothetical protein